VTEKRAGSGRRFSGRKIRQIQNTKDRPRSEKGIIKALYWRRARTRSLLVRAVWKRRPEGDPYGERTRKLGVEAEKARKGQENACGGRGAARSERKGKKDAYRAEGVIEEQVPGHSASKGGDTKKATRSYNSKKNSSRTRARGSNGRCQDRIETHLRSQEKGARERETACKSNLG